MTMLDFLLYLVAFICFLLVAFEVPVRRVSPLGIGLAAWVLVPLHHAWPG